MEKKTVLRIGVSIVIIIAAFIVIGSITTCSTSVNASPIFHDEPVVIKVEVQKDELHDYFNALRQLESSGNYQARRPKSQYIGAYQIGDAARTTIGLDRLNNEDGYETMLNYPDLQDMIAMRYLQVQIGYMKDHITKYSGNRVGGWYVTPSGIIAMAHLLGHKNAKAFLDSNGKTITRDGNQRPITDYLQLNGFHLYVDSITDNGYAMRFLTSRF